MDVQLPWIITLLSSYLIAVHSTILVHCYSHTTYWAFAMPVVVDVVNVPDM